MAANMTAILNATMHLSTGFNYDGPLAKTLSNIASASFSTSVITEQYSAIAIPFNVTFPTAICHLAYVRCLPTSANNLVVAWTPNASFSTTVITLTPGSPILYFDATLGGGLTALALSSTSGTALAEYILAG